MSPERIHIFIQVCFNTFPENQKSEIYIIKKFINFDYQIFSGSCKNWHLLWLLGYSNKYKEKAINDKSVMDFNL